MLLQEQNAGFQVCQVYKIQETGCLFLVIDSNSISAIVLARNAKLVGTRRGGDSTTFRRCMTFCGSGGGEAEERDCSLNCWQFMVLTTNCQQKIASSLSRSFGISF